MGRIEIVLNKEATADEVRERMSRVFGLANYSVATRVPLDFDGMADAIVSMLPPREGAGSFRVRVRRADQRLPDAVARSRARPRLAGVARARLEGRSRSRRSRDPRRDHSRALRSVHGPEARARRTADGHAGRVMALLSGGIDSPVAAWRMMRRGCQVTLVHFHSAPFLSNISQEKARRLAEVLTTLSVADAAVPDRLRRTAAADHA